MSLAIEIACTFVCIVCAHIVWSDRKDRDKWHGKDDWWY